MLPLPRRGQQLQPRVGRRVQLPGRAGVVRASYNRLYQTPPNENLLLSSSEAASRLAPESVREALGGAYRPVHPERQHVFEAGFQRGLGASRASTSRSTGSARATSRTTTTSSTPASSFRRRWRRCA
jgi:hypothetical protein